MQEKHRLLEVKAQHEQQDKERLARESSPRVNPKKTMLGINTAPTTPSSTLSETPSQGIQPSVSLDDMF